MARFSMGHFGIDTGRFAKDLTQGAVVVFVTVSNHAPGHKDGARKNDIEQNAVIKLGDTHGGRDGIKQQDGNEATWRHVRKNRLGLGDGPLDRDSSDSIDAHQRQERKKDHQGVGQGAQVNAVAKDDKEECSDNECGLPGD